MDQPTLNPTPFHSAWIKFIRASQHRNTLEAELKAFLENDPDGITIKGDTEWERPPLRSVLFVIDQVPQFPPEFGAMVGDVVHNLRSALDHLTWRLVKRGSQPRPKMPKKVQFPFATSGARFDAQIKERLPGVPARPHLALIRRFQPYRRDMRGKGMRALRSFNDTDKHRVLIPTVLGVPKGSLNIRAPGSDAIEAELLFTGVRVAKPGTPVARALVTGPHSGVHVHGQFEAEPTLGRGRSAESLLRHMGALVFELLDCFDRIELGRRYAPALPGLSVNRPGHDDPLRGLV